MRRRRIGAGGWSLLVTAVIVGTASVALGAGVARGDLSLALQSRAETPLGFPLKVSCSEICLGDRSPSSSPKGAIAFFRARFFAGESPLWAFDLMVGDSQSLGARRVVADIAPVSAPVWSPNAGSAPIWSPDGRSLLMSCVDRSRQVATKAPDAWSVCTVDPARFYTVRPTMITAPHGWDVPVDWSPDGGRIAFHRNMLNACCQLWIAKPDGSDARLIGGGQGDTSSYVDGAWSPDGERLAMLTFQRQTNPSIWELWLGDAEGARRQRLTTFAEHHGATILDWSPDGRKIYLRYGSAGPSAAGVAVVDTVDGTLDTLVRRGPGTLGQVELSPDGTMLGLVEANTIKLADADGSNERVLAQGVSPQVRPPSRPGLTTFSWLPDSRSIVYVADGECPTVLGLHTIRTDGKGRRRLTQFCGTAGTERADALEGTAGTDAIYGRAGDDRIRAGSRADNLRGGRGNDELYGGEGDDRIHGGPGRDTIAGGLGWDAIVAGDGEVDRVRCGPGRDIVWMDRRDIVARDCEEVVWRGAAG